MTIAGTSFMSCHPCSVCGIEGVQVWLDAETERCWDCRKGHMSDTSLVVHEGDFEQQIQEHTLAIEEYASQDALAHSIKSASDFTEAGSIINEIKRHLKELEAVEKSATRPILHSLDVIRGWFKPAKAQALKAREIWDGHIRTYLAAQAAEQAEVQRQLQAAAKAGNKVEMRAQLTKLEQAPVAQGVSIRQVWEFTITAASLVPQQYWIIDTDLIQAEMRKRVAAGEEPAIPGVLFTQKQVVAATGK